MRQKELRIALVCYGGVSLAVYMHGVTKELWKLARASRALHDAAPPPEGDTEAVYCRYLARRALRSGATARTAREVALRGLKLDARAFLSDARRGWPTLISALIAPVIPRAARIRVFA